MATLKRLETKSGFWFAWLSVLALAAGCGSSSLTVDAGGGEDHPQASDATNDFGGPKRGDAGDGIQESATQDGGGGDAVAEVGEDAPITCAPACPADQTCLANGQCTTVCGQGQTKCGPTCTDLTIDSKNCGACGTSCPTNQFCSQGKCVMACGQGETKCGQSCVNLANNYGNCGACGLSCTNLEACVMQLCKCVPPNASCNGACISLNNNHDNCGACNNRCGGDFVCNGNSCGCPGGRQSCPNKSNVCVQNLNACCGSTEAWCGHCQNVTTDRSNCGACGHACSGVEVCSNRTCSCPASQPKSCGNGVCILSSQCCPDQISCGTACCGGNQLCVNNACVTPVCTENAHRCNNGNRETCTNGAWVPTPCPAGDVCGGAGICSCVPDCGGKACGADNGCGAPCQTGTCGAANQTCNAGVCMCVPSCGGKACGADNGCGAPCQTGTCGAANQTCNAGVCVCVPSCGGKACGADNGCGAPCQTGTCGAANQTCNAGVCVCNPDCGGKACGADNGCGTGTCHSGKCTAPQTCGGSGTQDVCGCTPSSCDNKACGADDGCGSPCQTGSCPGHKTCTAGVCV